MSTNHIARLHFPYREGAANNHSFPIVFLGDASLFRVESGGKPKSDVGEYWGGGIAWATLVDLPASDFITEITSTQRTITEKGLRESGAKMIPANSVIVSTRATIGRIAHVFKVRGRYGKAVVLLLCGGDKGSQVADIKRAKELWLEWKRRQA